MQTSLGLVLVILGVRCMSSREDLSFMFGLVLVMVGFGLFFDGVSPLLNLVK